MKVWSQRRITAKEIKECKIKNNFSWIPEIQPVVSAIQPVVYAIQPVVYAIQPIVFISSV